MSGSVSFHHHAAIPIQTQNQGNLQPISAIILPSGQGVANHGPSAED